MIRCIQNTDMPPKERDYDNTVLTLRLNSAEAVRFWTIMDSAKSRNAYVGKSDVCRELLGLTPPNAVTKEEINYFRTGEKVVKGMPVATASKTGGIMLVKTSPRRAKRANK